MNDISDGSGRGRERRLSFISMFTSSFTDADPSSRGVGADGVVAAVVDVAVTVEDVDMAIDNQGNVQKSKCLKILKQIVAKYKYLRTGGKAINNHISEGKFYLKMS